MLYRKCYKSNLFKYFPNICSMSKENMLDKILCEKGYGRNVLESPLQI